MKHHEILKQHLDQHRSEMVRKEADLLRKSDELTLAAKVVAEERERLESMMHRMEKQGLFKEQDPT